METPQQMIGRLLAALERLTHEEEHLFKTGFHAESVAVQERAMPLAAKIAEILTTPGTLQSLEPALQDRLQVLLQNRLIHYEQVSIQLDAASRQFKKLAEATTRARRLRPIYGDMPTSGGVVSCAG